MAFSETSREGLAFSRSGVYIGNCGTDWTGVKLPDMSGRHLRLESWAASISPFLRFGKRQRNKNPHCCGTHISTPRKGEGMARVLRCPLRHHGPLALHGIHVRARDEHQAILRLWHAGPYQYLGHGLLFVTGGDACLQGEQKETCPPGSKTPPIDLHHSGLERRTMCLGQHLR